MSTLSTKVKVGLAILAAILIVAVPHLLTVDRGDEYTLVPGDVHPCSPLPDASTFRIFVRNVTCDEGTSLATTILSSAECRAGSCQPSGDHDFKCNRSARAQGRLFWLCRTGGGEKVRFVIAGKS